MEGPVNVAKLEDSDMVDEEDDLLEGQMDAWLCTCSEEGVFKVGLKWTENETVFANLRY